MMRRLLLVVVAACGAAPAPAPRNAAPRGPTPTPAPVVEDRTAPWIAKLGDPRDGERAVSELEQLGDPRAIRALGELWVEQGRPVRALQVLVALARPLTPQQARDEFFVDYETTGRPASWDLALPFLRLAVIELEEASPRAVDSATRAAEVLGEIQRGRAELANLAQRPPTKRNLIAVVTAIRALGKLVDDRAASTRALLPVLARPRPPAGQLEPLQLFLATTGAAINALGELRDDAAIDALVLALFQVPELRYQVRRALVGLGARVDVQLHEALRGTLPALANLGLERSCDDHQVCSPVSAREVGAAIVLGDRRDATAVPLLVAALAAPALPAYYADGQPAPVTQRHAIVDALRKIGSPDAAAALQALWRTAGDVEIRVLATGVSPYVARDAAAVPALLELIATPKLDDTLRFSAATALARLSRDPRDLAALLPVAQKYLDAATTREKELAAKQPGVAAAEHAFEAAKLRAKGDPAALRKAKDEHRRAIAPARQLEDQLRGYRGFARSVQVHAARIEVAARCHDDLACLAATLTTTLDEELGRVEPYVHDVRSWTRSEQDELREAAIERALLELGKRGAAAAPHLDALLGAAASESRPVREAALLALPAIAPRPCPACVTGLDRAIAKGEGQPALGDAVAETRIVRALFLR